MTETDRFHDTRQRVIAQATRMRFWALRQPLAALALLLGAGMLCGAAACSASTSAIPTALRAAAPHSMPAPSNRASA
ncbi:MAG: hypothetical protein EOP93_14980, partial [Lysobacteraceae bacterium]